jgi:hypothetical protein
MASSGGRGTVSRGLVLQFLGLAHDGACRPDGRIHSYRSTPLLSEGACAVLRAVDRRRHRSRGSVRRTLPVGPRSVACRASVITTLARVGLEQTRGSYKRMLVLFGIAPTDYLKFMDFLRHRRLKPGP